MADPQFISAIPGIRSIRRINDLRIDFDGTTRSDLGEWYIELDDDVHQFVSSEVALALVAATNEIVRLREAGDALLAAVDKVRGFIAKDPSIPRRVEEASDLWKEARRG